MDAERMRLGQTGRLASLERPTSPLDMMTVFQTGNARGFNQHDHFVCCALIPSACIGNVEELLVLSGFRDNVYAGLPGSTGRLHEGSGKRKLVYWRYGNELGVEPLVTFRSFHGIRDGHVEISEEFRLFHNLYYDDNNNCYIKIDEVGDEYPVVLLKKNGDKVKIRLQEIRQFLAIKEMHLAIQFNYLEFSTRTLEELSLVEEVQRARDDSLTWEFFYANMPQLPTRRRSFSSLSGIKTIEPLPKSHSGFPGFAIEQEKKQLNFIIGLDDDGSEIEYTCDPSALANFFGKNPGAPNFLTPVYFKKEVLDKYYAQPSRYEITGDRLQRGELWSTTIDNESRNHVVVWLGDLAKLPYKEQLYWRSFNIVSRDGLSRSFFTRQMLAKMHESDLPEDAFLRLYQELLSASQEHLGWSILLPLEDDDEHHIQSLRVHANNEQREFDQQVLSLTKILIDSLNEAHLVNLISPKRNLCGKRGISMLEYALRDCHVDGIVRHIGFLRDLQGLRSSGMAHRKGRRYRNVSRRFDMENRDLKEVFVGILNQAVMFLEFLIEVIMDGRLEDATCHECSSARSLDC